MRFDCLKLLSDSASVLQHAFDATSKYLKQPIRWAHLVRLSSPSGAGRATPAAGHTGQRDGLTWALMIIEYSQI